MNDFNYDTYCGLYCGSCSVMKAYQTGIKDPLACTFNDEMGMELKCHGCKTDHVFENCAQCSIRPCAKERGVEHCIDCPDYPCQIYMTLKLAVEKLPHWSMAAANIETIRNNGVAKWLEEQAEQWRCADCQIGYSWYSTHCSNCGKDLQDLKPYKSTFDKSIFQMKMPNPDELFKLEAVFRQPGMDSVKTVKDIVYSFSEPGSELHLDLYLPPNHVNNHKLPVVLLVHGDGPVGGIKDSGQYTSLGRLLAVSGFVGAAFNHRMLMQGFGIDEVISDIENLIQFIIKNADEYGIDENRIAIWSLSAGVPFGLYAGMHNSPRYIKCMAAYYGFGDLTSLCTLLKGVNNSEGVDEQAEQYSPLSLLSLGPDKVAPILIARAGKDQFPMLLDSLDRFIATALANNLNIDVFNHPTGVHAFDLHNNEPRTQEIIGMTLEFFKRHLSAI